jgi:hypothetical protein
VETTTAAPEAISAAEPLPCAAAPIIREAIFVERAAPRLVVKAQVGAIARRAVAIISGLQP